MPSLIVILATLTTVTGQGDGPEDDGTGYVFIEENKECDSSLADNGKSSVAKKLSAGEKTKHHCREKCKYTAGMFIYGRPGTDGEGKCMCEEEVEPGKITCQTSGTNNYDLYAITELDCQTKVKEDPDCVFPFIYENKKYYECTDINHDDVNRWCATKVDNGGKMTDWKNCKEGAICKECTIDNGKLVWESMERSPKRTYKVECNPNYKRKVPTDVYAAVATCSMGQLIPALTCEKIVQNECLDTGTDCEKLKNEHNGDGCNHYTNEGYMKKYCATTCNLNPCKDYGGVCKKRYPFMQLECECNPGFEGVDCGSFKQDSKLYYKKVGEDKKCAVTKKVYKDAKDLGECAAACYKQAGMFRYQRSGNAKECWCETEAKQYSCQDVQDTGFDLYQYYEYYKYMDKAECNSAEFEDASKSSIEITLTATEKSPEHCAKKCKGVAGMFIYGIDNTAGEGKCQCEREAIVGERVCKTAETNNYNLYTYI